MTDRFIGNDVVCIGFHLGSKLKQQVLHTNIIRIQHIIMIIRQHAVILEGQDNA